MHVYVRPSDFCSLFKARQVMGAYMEHAQKSFWFLRVSKLRTSRSWAVCLCHFDQGTYLKYWIITNFHNLAQQLYMAGRPSDFAVYLRSDDKSLDVTIITYSSSRSLLQTTYEVILPHPSSAWWDQSKSVFNYGRIELATFRSCVVCFTVRPGACVIKTHHGRN